MRHRILLPAVVLAAFLQTATANLRVSGRYSPDGSAGRGATPGRVLHFPQDESIGEVRVQDGYYVTPEITREFHPGYVFGQSDYLCPAQGTVAVPVGKRALLNIKGNGATRRRCLEFLKSLAPDDVGNIVFWQPVQVDDGFMPDIARLTGMTGFCVQTARITPHGWSMLATLPQLEHMCTPHGLTDAEMAEIAKLRTLREMEIVAPRLTDAGLASLSQLRSLEVLHLDGTFRMTDEGLKALATLPKLRHLRLSGPFTDQGLEYLAAMPALKVLWLESPNTTEEGLRHLSRSASLERLCVPWLDRIREPGLTHLRSIPRLRALGVGNAWDSNAGVAALASLTNLEVLAIKGSPALTDEGLKPLAGMPKLRALQIYNSRITEQGLTSLSQCKALDSLEITSAAPIGESAVARLRAELPGLQTVHVSLPEPRKQVAGIQSAEATRRR